MNRQEKLVALQDKVIDVLLDMDDLDAKSLSVAVTLLKNNKVVEDKPIEKSIQEEMDELVKEAVNGK